MIFSKTFFNLLAKTFTIIFFLLSNVYISKAQRGATLVHREYTREHLTRIREKNKKIKIANH
jgi:quinolinate synthase